MSKKKKKRTKSFCSVKAAEDVRRKDEIEKYGKVLSLRPSRVMKSLKDYKRKWNLKDYTDD